MWIARERMREPVRSIQRFPTGLAHWVYDVVAESGRALVVRMGREGDAPQLSGASYWSKRLRPLGVPLPALLHEGTREGMPYHVLERLPGTDLGLVYGALTLAEKHDIAAEIVRIQERVHALPEGKGFGFVHSEQLPFPHGSWEGVVRGSLARSRARIAAGGVVSADLVSRVERTAARFAGYFARIRPRAFLDDTTTKNVIVDHGRLSGIVDVDVVCFGDPLFTPALTRTALICHGLSGDYVDGWCALLALTQEQQEVLRFYAALFCLDLMSEIGHSFNRGEVVPLDPERLGRLTESLEAQLLGLG